MQANEQRNKDVSDAAKEVVREIDNGGQLGPQFVLAVKLAEAITGDALASPGTKKAAREALDMIEKSFVRVRAAKRAAV